VSSEQEDFTSSNAEAIDKLVSETGLLEVSLSSAEISDAAQESLDFLASLILTDIYQYGYPPLFHAMWQLLCTTAKEEVGKPKYALGIPRGFSKTVVLKLYCVWLILFSTRRFILVICNTATLAENFLADVIDMLEAPNIVATFGHWGAAVTKDNAALKKFSFRGRNITLAALGSGSSLRGLNIKFVRPDVVIMDDMQNRDEAANPEVAKELLVWMLGTLMKACDPHRCVFIFVGNMYPFEGSILRKLKASSEWLSFITGAILADGNSLWPEHRSLDDLLQELQSDTEMGHPEIFFSEVMNDEDSGTVSGFDVSKIPDYPRYLDSVQAQGGFIIIDPSLGKKKGDDLGIGAILIYDGVPVLREVISEKMDPGATIQRATLLAVKYHMQLIVVEGGAYQASLIFWFNHVYQQLGITGINVGEITTGGMQKNSRIRDGLKMLLPQGMEKKPKLLLHKDVRSAVIYQITQWNPLKANNKDELLDIIAYIYKVIELHEHWLPLLISDVMATEMPAAETAESLPLSW
jgi:hypothetical protein